MAMDFNVFDQKLQKTISFAKVSYERDVEMIHSWMNEEHVHPFWQLNIPINSFRNHLQKALKDTHQTLYLGFINEVPMSYWEAYWVKEDIIEGSYENKPYDQGIHLLIGHTDYLGLGYSLHLLRVMVSMQLKEKRTERIVAEPDIRNKKMIHIFEKCGFTPQKPIDLPDKTGLLMICERKQFERKWGNA
ncbi:GNAT family N-acetyltransferase [Pseudalkalibacillus sp. NRS-1564]|uniref:GNAT family N-acetyltransferase n=1 Tax=Pseudalkalibacillus sp. NRS-1564 TaxID=3233900 RepID=UPI003D2B3982